MRLAEWLDWKGVSRAEAATLFDCGIQTLAHMCKKVPRSPGRKLAKRIVDGTGGAVTYADLFTEDPAELGQAPPDDRTAAA